VTSERRKKEKLQGYKESVGIGQRKGVKKKKPSFSKAQGGRKRKNWDHRE